MCNCIECIGDQPEPQAQAVEPEELGLSDTQWTNVVNDPALRVMGKEDAINHAVKRTEHKCIENAKSALAKKDAALKACVEVLEYLKNVMPYEGWATDSKRMADAAITQAQEVLK